MVHTVLIVDDEAQFRCIARTLLEAGGFDVLGEAGSGAEAVSAARDLNPDIVLLDVQLPDADGFVVSRSLTDHRDGPQVVLCSARALEDYGRHPREFGAVGFLSKADLSAAAMYRLVAVEPNDL